MNQCPALIYAHCFLLAHRNSLHTSAQNFYRCVFCMFTVCFISLVLTLYIYKDTLLSTCELLSTWVLQYILYMRHCSLHANNILYKRKITFTCTSFPTYSQYFLHASCLFLDPRISPYNHVQCAFYTQTMLYVIVQKNSIFCRSTRSCLK